MAAGWFKFKGKSMYPELGSNPQRSQFTYGFKSDREFRMPWLQGRDLALEREVIQFVSKTVDVPEPGVNIGEWLKDGVILCKLLDKMAPGSVRPNKKRPQMLTNENIQIFLKRCKELGFEDHQLFEVSDLVDEKNIGRVLNCLAGVRDEMLKRNNMQFYF